MRSGFPRQLAAVALDVADYNLGRILEFDDGAVAHTFQRQPKDVKADAQVGDGRRGEGFCSGKCHRRWVSLPRFRRREVERMPSSLQCIDCAQQYPIQRLIYTCEKCGGLLDVRHDLERTARRTNQSRAAFDERLGAHLNAPYNSGVWRFKELIHPGHRRQGLIVSRMEGDTNLYELPRVADLRRRRHALSEARRREPHRFFQRSGHDDRRHAGAYALGMRARRLRLDRQHVGINGVVCGARRYAGDHLRAKSANRAWGSWRKASHSARPVCKSTPISTAIWNSCVLFLKSSASIF